MLPSEKVVIEVLETAEPDGEIVKACQKLRSLGYTIALDDFVWHPRFEPLVELAHIIKVDMRLTSRAEQERLVSTYQPRGITMLAEKVETREEFEWATNLGYDYFQGYFFARPTIISGKELQPAVVTCLRLLRQLQTPELDFRSLEELIHQDVALTYKLFLYVNSVLFARQGNIQSIRRALAHLGENGIRRWATVATLPRLTRDKPEELVACALVRARFSENLTRHAGDPSHASAYLTGLFSLFWTARSPTLWGK
jgi:EAL and modified HD-GYP domain-containing signal transduction protein